MKKLLIPITLLLWIAELAAQQPFPNLSKEGYEQVYIFVGDNKPIINPWILKDTLFVDTTIIKVAYDLKFIPDIDSGKIHITRMNLEIGRKWCTFYNLSLRYEDKVSTWIETKKNNLNPLPGISVNYIKTPEDEELQEIMGERGWINSEIWIDRKSCILKERLHDYKERNLALEYEEELPELNWELTGKSNTIAEYQCIEAKANFRGREWTAWFAPEIPVSCGPWKFNGLPGLIVLVEDSEGHYRWECVEVNQVEEPILYHPIPIKTQNRENIKKYLRNVHLSPYMTLSNTPGKTLFWGNSERLDESWIIPYNPIERE